MKCSVCGKEFGDGDNCQYCGTDRVSGLGKYDGYAPKNSSTNNDKQVSAPRTKKQSANTNGYTLCYKCAEPIPDGSVYCPKCGTKLIVECPKCGHTYSSQYPICNQCGTDRVKYIAEQKRLAELRAAEEKRRQEEAERAKAEQARRARLAEEARMAEERRKQEAERLRLEEQRRLAAEAEKARKAKEREKKRQERLEKEKRKQEELAIMDTECYKEAYAYLYNMYDKFIKAKVRNIHCYANFPLGLLCFLVTLLVMLLVYCYNLALFACVEVLIFVMYIIMVLKRKTLERYMHGVVGVVWSAVCVVGIIIAIMFLGATFFGCQKYSLITVLSSFAEFQAEVQTDVLSMYELLISFSWWPRLGAVVDNIVDIVILIVPILILLMTMIVLRGRPLHKMGNEIIDKWVNKYFRKHDTFKCAMSRDVVSRIIYEDGKMQEVQKARYSLFRQYDRVVSAENKIKELVISEYKKLV